MKKNSGEYKGYKWKSQRDLSKQLGYNDSYVSIWLFNNPDKTIYDCIDYVLEKGKKYMGKTKRKNNNEIKTYKGYVWSTQVDLAKICNVNASTIYRWLDKNPDKTEEDCIDFYLNKNNKGPEDDRYIYLFDEYYYCEQFKQYNIKSPCELETGIEGIRVIDKSTNEILYLNGKNFEFYLDLVTICKLDQINKLRNIMIKINNETSCMNNIEFYFELIDICDKNKIDKLKYILQKYTDQDK